MAHTHETRRAAGDAAGLGNSSCLAADSSENKAQPLENQAVATVNRDLLRDFVFDAAQEAAPYLAAIQNLIVADDRAGLKYVATKFVVYAREIAKGCRELIGSDAGSTL